MAINLVDSGATISLEFTTDYNAGRGIISATKIFINKEDFEVRSEGNYVIITDKQKDDNYRILYSDITIPSGASAAAIAALIEAFQDTAVGGLATAANQSTEITSLQLIDDAIATLGSAVSGLKAVLMAGTDGTNARAQAMDTSGSILLGAAEKTIGRVGGNTTIVTITGAQVGVAGAAYTTGDVLGSTSPILFTPARIIGGSGIIQSIYIHDLSKQSIALDVVIFSQNPTGTTFTDNGALDVADADLPKVRVVSIVAADYAAFADNSVATKMGINLPFKTSQNGDLWFCLVTRGAPTYVANELSVAFGILQD